MRWVSYQEVAGDSESAHPGSKLKYSKLKIDFFTPSRRVVRNAGIGLPARSRAPALVAGWAPRISQKPRFGARLSASGTYVQQHRITNLRKPASEYLHGTCTPDCLLSVLPNAR